MLKVGGEGAKVTGREFSARRRRGGRQPGQNGSLEEVRGAHTNRWQLSWYEYRIDVNGVERRHHCAKTLDAARYSRADALRMLRGIVETIDRRDSNDESSRQVAEIVRLIRQLPPDRQEQLRRDLGSGKLERGE